MCGSPREVCEASWPSLQGVYPPSNPRPVLACPYHSQPLPTVSLSAPCWQLYILVFFFQSDLLCDVYQTLIMNQKVYHALQQGIYVRGHLSLSAFIPACVAIPDVWLRYDNVESIL